MKAIHIIAILAILLLAGCAQQTQAPVTPQTPTAPTTPATPQETAPQTPTATPQETTPTPSIPAEMIVLTDRTADPSTLTIQVGGSVTFKSNAVKNSHVIIVDELGQRTTGMKPGDSFTFKFDKAGNYTFRDVWVASLRGTIIVE